MRYILKLYNESGEVIRELKLTDNPDDLGAFRLSNSKDAHLLLRALDDSMDEN